MKRLSQTEPDCYVLMAKPYAPTLSGYTGPGKAKVPPERLAGSHFKVTR